MHELSVGRALIGQVESIVLHRNASAVTGITLRIGPLSGIEPALLRAAYQHLQKDSIVQDAALQIIESRVRLRCGKCDMEAETEPNRLLCPACGSMGTLVSGDEMLIESVDLVVSQAD